MTDASHPPSPDRISDVVADCAPEDAVAYVEQFQSAPVDIRRDTLASLQSVLERRPAALDSVLPATTPFLTDEERSVRLRAVKLFVAVAEEDPVAIESAVGPLTDRLTDESEFYFVRARAAEALGYLALERPDVVTSPEVLAELVVGLSLDEPEVMEKLAKALEHVALGDPNRPTHRLSTLSEHFDDGSELVRYHLVTATAVVGCERPDAAAELADALADRLTDESPYVRGRAAEALGAAAPAAESSSLRDELSDLTGDEESFVADRARFAVCRLDGEDEHPTESVGTVGAIRETTHAAESEILAPDESCPNCGVALPEVGPPMCPQCGAPY